MLDITPKLVYDLYYITIVSLTVLTVLNLLFSNIKTYHSTFTIIVVSFIILLLGFRPLEGHGVGTYFGDTVNYYHSFFNKYQGEILSASNDLGFAIFTKFFYEYANVELYFFTLTFLYVFVSFWAIKRIDKKNVFIIFLMMIIGFLYYPNAVNGIRSGIASSFVLLGMTYEKRLFKSLLFFLIAIGFHKSMVLPVLAYFITFFLNNTKTLIIWWFLSIVLSFTLGNQISKYLSVFNLVDNRFSDYLTKYKFEDAFRYTGFRWDFVLYSAVVIYFGWIYIYKKHYSNKFYIHLLNTYIIANSFWILVIRSSFSNRFAALSWFLIPILLMYPLVNYKMYRYQKLIISIFLLGNLFFTLIMK